MLLTSREVCQELRISASTLSRIVAAGELVCLRIGGQLRFTRADLESYLQGARERPGQKRSTPPEKPRARVAPKSRRMRSKEEAFDMEAYREAGIYIPGKPYFKGMKIVIPSPAEMEKGGVE